MEIQSFKVLSNFFSKITVKYILVIESMNFRFSSLYLQCRCGSTIGVQGEEGAHPPNSFPFFFWRVLQSVVIRVEPSSKRLNSREIRLPRVSALPRTKILTQDCLHPSANFHAGSTIASLCTNLYICVMTKYTLIPKKLSMFFMLYLKSLKL
jgi:hypothetical protein